MNISNIINFIDKQENKKHYLTGIVLGFLRAEIYSESINLNDVISMLSEENQRLIYEELKLEGYRIQDINIKRKLPDT